MRKTIYKIAFVSALLVTTSCGNRKSELETLETQKAELKKEIGTLSTTLKGIESLIAELDTVEVDRRKPVGAKVLEKSEFVSYVEINGVVESNENVTVRAGMSGGIRTILVREGAVVRKGQVLARLDDNIIRNQIKELQKALEFATQLYDKQKRLHDQNVGTEIQFLEAKNRKESLEQQIKTAETQKSKAVITSPIKGKVDKIYPHSGEMTSPSNPFALIVNTADVYVSADVSEAYFYKLSIGDEAQLRMLTGGKQEMASRLTYKGNYINPGNRTFQVHASLDAERVYPPNMMMALRVVNERLKDVYTVPRLYIQSDSKGNFLYQVVAKDGKDYAAKLRVAIKESYNGLVVITSEELKDNTRIITNNFRGVDAGSEVKVVK